MRAEPVADLRSLYREPAQTSLDKEIRVLDPHARALIETSPFMVVASADANGTYDASPKGGPPGFVRVLDDAYLAWGDLSDNRRLDTMQNIASNPHVGLLFFVPRRDESLRVNGRGTITRDPASSPPVRWTASASPRSRRSSRSRPSTCTARRRTGAAGFGSPPPGRTSPVCRRRRASGATT